MASDYRVRIVLDGQDNASDDIRRVNQELRRTGETVDGAGGGGGLWQGFNRLSGAIAGMAGAFGAMYLGQKVLELRELGQEVSNVGNTFEALSGGAVQAARNLDMLRTATYGVVDDTTLMSGANRLLMMNLASTGEEAAKLAEVAVTLGRAMKMEPQQAFEDFGALLANQSIPRLDNFGISSAAVRARIEELTSGINGLSREQAFSQAVLEQGALAMERLGDAVTQNISEVDKLAVRFQNALNSIGDVTYDIAEGVAGAINAILESGDEMEDELNRRREEHKRYAEDIAAAYRLALAELPAGTPVQGTPQRFTAGATTGLDILHGAAVANGPAVRVGGYSPEQLFSQFRMAAETYERQTGIVVQNMQTLEAALALQQGAQITLSSEMAAAAQFWLQERYAAANAGAQPIQQYGPIAGVIDESTGIVRGMDPYFVRMQQIERERAAAAERTRQALIVPLAMRNLYPTGMEPTMTAAGMRVYGLGRDLAPQDLRRIREESWTPTAEQLTAAQWQAHMFRTGEATVYAGPRVEEMRERQQQQAAQQALDFVRDAARFVQDGIGRAAGFAENISEAMERARERAERIVTTFMATGVETGPAAEWYRLVAGSITDQAAREQFERSMSLTTWRNDLPAIIASLPAGEREMAAQALGAVFATGEAPGSLAEAMRMAGYFRAPGAGQGREFAVKPGMTDTEAMIAGGFSSLEAMYSAMGWQPGRVQVGTFRAPGSGWRRIVGPGGPVEQGDAGFEAVNDAISAANQLEEDLDRAIEKPRSLPVTLDIIAETAGVSGPLRTLVIQVVQEWMRDNGGQLRPANNRTGAPPRPGQRVMAAD